jgi:VCBS repeat-containing protein
MIIASLIYSAYAAGQGAQPVEGESFTKPSGTQVVTGNQYSGGKALKITSGKALPTKRVTITETSNVLVRACAGQKGGSPTLTIRVDGENAGTRRITSSVLSDYLYPGIILEPGTYTIGLKGGDLAEGRYVFVDVVRFPAVTSPNEPPVAENDTATTDEDTPTDIAVLANDTDDDGDPLTIASVSNPAHGSAVVASGKVNYTPNANYNGPDSFSYTVSDGNGGTDTATVSITVTSVDDAPVAEDDSATTPEDTAVSIDVLANDTDGGDGGTMTIESVTQPQNGTVTITGGGSGLTYEPDENYCNDGSPTDDFTYTLNGGSEAKVSVTVTCVEDDPVAVNDNKTVAEDDPATTIDVLANDTDPDGGTMTIESVTQPQNGTVEITNNGSDLTYKPNADYCNGGSPTDNFTYTLSHGGSTATVSVKVTCVDDAPVAVNDSASVLEDAAATNVPVLTNDTDIDGGPKTISSASDPANGTVVVTGGGSGLTYKPDPNYCNDPGDAPDDTFTYTLERVMNSIRNGLEMRETEIAREPS